MNYESNDKMVSHPSHYQSNKGIEVIDVIEAFTEGLNGIEAVDTGNVLKYTCRWKDKNGLQDLEKAMWYLTHLINHLKEKQSNLEVLEIKNVPSEMLEELFKPGEDCIIKPEWVYNPNKNDSAN